MTGEFQVLHGDKLDRYERLETFYNDITNMVKEHEDIWGKVKMFGPISPELMKIKNIISKVDKPNLPGSHDF